MKAIEDQAFRTPLPPDAICHGVDSPHDLAVARGYLRQREMLREYARRKQAGEFPDGPAIIMR